MTAQPTPNGEHEAVCTVVIGRNPEGSIAEDTDYIRCGEQAVGTRGGFPMCDGHLLLFSLSAAPHDTSRSADG